MDVSQIVSLVLFSLIAIIMLFSILRGMIRGWKKSLLGFGWLVGIFVILLIFSSLITKGVANLSLSFLNLNIEGITIKNFTDLGKALLSSFELSDGSVAGELIASIPLMIANVFVFTILFWLLRLVTWPIYAIVSAVAFRKDRRAKKEWKKAGKPDRPIINGEVMPQKPNVRRGFGALIGVASGILICFVTLMPIMGVNGYIQQAQNIQISTELANKMTNDEASVYGSVLELENDKLHAESDDEKVSLITLYLNDDVLSYLNVYEDSVVGKVFGAIGLNKLGELTFNGLAKVSVGGETISLKSELTNILELYSKAETLIIKYDLLNADQDTIKDFNQEDWNEIISTSRYVMNKAFESKFVAVILNNYFGDIVEIAANEFLDEKIENDIENEILKEVCKASVDYLVEMGNNHEVSKVIYKEIDNILKVCECINNYNLLNPIINNNYSKVLPENTPGLEANLVKDFKEFVDYMNDQPSSNDESGKYIQNLSKDLAESLLNCSVLKDLLPQVEETAVRSLYKQLLKEEEYNKVYDEYYLNGEADFNINSSIDKFREINTDLFTNLFSVILNIGYNYDEVNDLVTTIKNGGEDSLKNIAIKIEESDVLEGFLESAGGLVDIVVESDAMSSSVETGLINKLLDIAKTSVNNSLTSTGMDEKLCTTILGIIDNAGEKIKSGDCKNLMKTIASTIISAFNVMDQIEQLTDIKNITPEELEDLSVTDIADALQNLTEDNLVKNEEIADILQTTIDNITDEENISDSVLNKKVNESDPNSKTIAETIIDNIATNKDLNWSEEGVLVEDIAKKAIELTNKTEGETTDLVEDIQDLLDGLYKKDAGGNYITDENGNNVSKSNIITPDLIEYFKTYLTDNFGASN